MVALLNAATGLIGSFKKYVEKKTENIGAIPVQAIVHQNGNGHTPLLTHQPEPTVQCNGHIDEGKLEAYKELADEIGTPIWKLWKFYKPGKRTYALAADFGLNANDMTESSCRAAQDALDSGYVVREASGSAPKTPKARKATHTTPNQKGGPPKPRGTREKGPVAHIEAMLRRAGEKKKPISREKILDNLVRVFGEDKREGMAHTVYVQVKDKKYGMQGRKTPVAVKGDDEKGFWVEE